MVKIKKEEIDYEIEGCWSGLETKHNCRCCGALYVTVPKEGHPNSHFWELQQHSKERLVCCPNNCSVIVAEKKMKEYLKVRSYCTKESESWDYSLYYPCVKNAWVDRKGKVYPVGIREHLDFAYDRCTTEQILEQKGWLKLTSMEFMWEKSLSKKQINFVFDYLVATNHENLTKAFMEKAKVASYYFKIKVR